MTTSGTLRRHLAPSSLLRVAAVGAPWFLLLYGLLRLVDGLDGEHGPGLAWNAGHTMFLVAFVLLGILIAGLRRLLSPTVTWHRVLANIATVAGLTGVAAFLWVILGDLFGTLDEYAPVPDPVYAAGPLLFQAGLTVLLVMLAAIRPRRIPGWSPLLVLLGFVPIAVNLDLLPLGAVLIFCGLLPLARRQPAPLPEAVRTARAPAALTRA